jgi:hypothetical protein
MPGELTEFSGDFTDVMVVAELRGSYPNVPISADVDYAALIDGDTEPVFVTLPIAKPNVKSGNNRYYDEAFALEVMKQTLDSKPIGLMGHLSAAERSTAFPRESLHWVGAARDSDGMIWGKAYLIGEARERVRRYKASGKSIATSIDAYAAGEWDESLKAYRMDAKTLRLNQIDLAPTDRAGVPELSVIPHLTSEMVESETERGLRPGTEQEQEPIMDKLQIINEMSAEDARLLPKSVREAILSEVAIPPEVAVVQELRSTLGVDDKADLATLVRELQEAKATQAKAAIATRITELAADPDKGIKVEPVRAMVVEMVRARNPQTAQEVEAAYSEIAASGPVTELLRGYVQTTMGPPQRTIVQPQNGGTQFFKYPDKEN